MNIRSRHIFHATGVLKQSMPGASLSSPPGNLTHAGFTGCHAHKDAGLPLGHDGYLKLWAPSQPKARVDYFLVDEAQDLNPVRSAYRSLLAALLVLMTFVPLISSFLSESRSETPIEERRRRGFAGWYFRTAKKAIEHRKACLAASLGLLVAGGVVFSTLKPQFFPKDLQYFSYIDVWLPEDTPAGATSAVTQQVESITRGVRKSTVEAIRSTDIRRMFCNR